MKTWSPLPGWPVGVQALALSQVDVPPVQFFVMPNAGVATADSAASARTARALRGRHRPRSRVSFMVWVASGAVLYPNQPPQFHSDLRNMAVYHRLLIRFHFTGRGL